jgi:hypothetical protein
LIDILPPDKYPACLSCKDSNGRINVEDGTVMCAILGTTTWLWNCQYHRLRNFRSPLT